MRRVGVSHDSIPPVQGVLRRLPPWPTLRPARALFRESRDTPDWLGQRVHPVTQDDDTTAQQPVHPVRCRRCGQSVTTPSERVYPLGEHIHERCNPHGYCFRFGCFGTAWGIATIGEATAGDTWFPGYRWRIVLCLGCGNHLGWRFQGSEGKELNLFYGLILERLVIPTEH